MKNLSRTSSLIFAAALLVLAAACSSGTDDGADAASGDTGAETQVCTGDEDCVSSDPCQSGTCTDGICEFAPADGGSCDDGNHCTENDECSGGVCLGTARDCDDGEFCNGVEECNGITGACDPGDAPEIDDGVECTIDECDEEADLVVHAPDHTACDDGNQCTANTCDPAVGDESTGCAIASAEGECDDGDPCTVNDACAEAECVGETKPCDDGLFCNGVESCEAETGDCLEGEAPELDDGVDCTVDECDDDEDEVLHTPDGGLCDDGEQCTEDVCDAEEGCTYKNLDGECDDGNDCTQGDACTAGECVSGPFVCAEDCTNDEDDDQDGLVDCEDPDCSYTLDCLDSGESCPTAYLLNQGDALMLGDSFEFAASTVGKIDDHAGSCSAATAGSADTVHVLELGEPLGLEMTVDFLGQAWPAIYILASDCEEEKFCDSTSTTQPLTAVTVLPAGTYFVVVDGAFAGDEGEYTVGATTFPPAATEVGCGNGIDDDADGFVDCDDDDCDGLPQCFVVEGEDCKDAFDLFDGPIIDDGSQWIAVHNGTSTGMKNDVAGSCDDDTQVSPDMVFTFALEDAMWLTASHDFEGTLYPALYLLDEACDEGEELACTKALNDAAELSLPLAAGTYFLVADGAYPGDAGPFTLEVFLDSLADTEGDCANGYDDDMDGMIDCDDDDCGEDVTCVGHPGDNCEMAFQINDGKAITADAVGTVQIYQESTEAKNNDYTLSCDEDTAINPDLVYMLELQDPLFVTLSYDFEGIFWPALAILDENCDTDLELGCETGHSGPAELTIGLVPGTYYIVLDAAYAGEQGDFTLTVSFDLPQPWETVCGDGLDDDLDGELDCADEDCAFDLLCVDPFEKNDTLETAWDLGALPDGDALTVDEGQLVYPDGDEDWYLFDVSAKGLLTVFVDPVETLDAKISLFSAAGDALASEDTGLTGVPEAIETYPILEPGSFAVMVEGWGIASGTGGYSLTFVLAPAPASESVCDDDMDGDLDGLTDCDDPDCDGTIACGAGETCDEPLFVNGGAAIDEASDGVQMVYEGTTIGYSGDLSGGCSAPSAQAPDAVWLITLATPMELSAAVEYEGLKWPAVYLLEGACDGAELACVAAEENGAVLEAALDAGDYYLVLDGNWEGDASDYTLTLVFSAPPVEGESCELPFALNGGAAIGEADDGLALTLEGDTTGMLDDLSGSCDEDTTGSADAVYSFELQDEMLVTLTHDFTGIYWPALYVFSGSCEAENELVCAAAFSEAAEISQAFDPGLYYVVIDASFFQDETTYTFTAEFAAVAGAENDCGDGIDNDNDGFTDCMDDECVADLACQGEACGTAGALNDANPIAAADLPFQQSVAGDTTGMADDLSGSCDEDTAGSADAVYSFTLTDAALATISLDFEGVAWPALYLFDGECGVVENELACVAAGSDAALIEDLALLPGTYYVVVDASWEGDEEVFSLDVALAAMPTSESDCGDNVDNDQDELVDCADDDCDASLYCTVAALPFAEDFEDEGEWPEGFTAAGPDELCNWEIAADGADGTAYTAFIEWGWGCSDFDGYTLSTPELDVSACDEIEVSFFEMGEWVSSMVWHGVGIESGDTEVAIDLEAPGEEWGATSGLTFDVSGLDTVNVFLGYRGDNADSWWVDQLVIECTVATPEPACEGTVDIATLRGQCQEGVVDVSLSGVTVTYVFGEGYFLQDDSAAIEVYVGEVWPYDAPLVGDLIDLHVTEYGSWANHEEIIASDAPVVTGQGDAEALKTDVSAGTLPSSDLESYYVGGTTLEVTAADGQNLTVAYGTATGVDFRVDAPGDLCVGATFDLAAGVVTQFYDIHRLQSFDVASDVVNIDISACEVPVESDMSNWGFEEVGQDDPPADFEKASSGFTALTDDSTAAVGLQSCELTWTSTSNQDFYQGYYTPIAPGQFALFLLAFLDNDPGGRIRTSLEFYDADKLSLGKEYGIYSEDDAAWDTSSGWYIVAPEGAAFVRAFVRMYDVADNWDGDATVYVDDWSLTAEDVEPN